jgi:hypothetical protein
MRDRLSLVPYKPEFYTRQKYTGVYDITSGVYLGLQTFRINSMFDPDYTSAGHQPYGFSVLCGATGSGAASQPYHSYTVYGLSYKIKITAGNYIIGAVGVSNVAAAWSGSTADRVIEQPGTVWDLRSNETIPMCFEGYLDVAKLQGVSKSKLFSDDQFSAIYNQNPTLSWYLNIAIQHMDFSSSTTAQCAVELIYHVKYWEPNTLATF